MTDEGFTIRYEAVLEYGPEADITPEQARENLLDLVARQPEFGTATIVDGPEPHPEEQPWTELDISQEGLALTLYTLDTNGDPLVIDEWWAPWADLISLDAGHEAWAPFSEYVQPALASKTITLDSEDTNQ